MGLFIRTMGIAWATIKIGMANRLQLKRLIFLRRPWLHERPSYPARTISHRRTQIKAQLVAGDFESPDPTRSIRLIGVSTCRNRCVP